MSEPNATALVPVAAPTLDSSGHTSGAELARITQGVDQRIAERQPAVTADMLPQSRGTNVPAKRQELWPGESRTPSLTKDGKVSDKWMAEMIANLPHNKGKQAQQIEQPADVQTVVPQFLSALYQTNYSEFEELAATIVKEYAPYFGYTNEGTAIDQEYLNEIPHHLQATMMSLPQETADELLLMPEGPRNDWLEREYERQSLLAEQQQAADEQWRQAERQGVELVASLASQYEQAHLTELRKWKTRDSEEDNERLRMDIVEGAMQEILSYPYYRQLFEDAQVYLLNAPRLRYYGREDEANASEARGRSLSQEFSQALGQVIKYHLGLHSGTGSATSVPSQKRGGAPPVKVVGAYLKSLFEAA